MRLHGALGVALGVCLAVTGFSHSYAQSHWAALASDRTAARVGDSLTVVILETNSAASASQSANRRDTRLSGGVKSGREGHSGTLELQGGSSGQGQMTRSGRLLAQIGVTVEEVLPNGDLRIAGAQVLDIDGERTAIRLTARVRPADITGDNTVLSSRLADARIGYDADGALARSGRPGPLNRLMSWMGLS